MQDDLDEKDRRIQELEQKLLNVKNKYNQTY